MLPQSLAFVACPEQAAALELLSHLRAVEPPNPADPAPAEGEVLCLPGDKLISESVDGDE